MASLKSLFSHPAAASKPASDAPADAPNASLLISTRGIETVLADFDRPETLVPAFTGAEAVLLVSGSEVGKRVDQHRNAIDAARKAGVGRVVYTSAPHATDSDLVLAPEHAETERLLAASGLPVTILRNNWYTENYAGTLESAAATGEIIGSAGNGRVASASRRDFADAAAVVLTTPGHDGAVYELSGDVAWTFHDLAQAAGSLLGREVRYRDVTPEEHAAILAAAGLDDGTAGFLVALDGNIRDGALADVTPTLRDLIGRPTTPLAEGLAATREENAA